MARVLPLVPSGRAEKRRAGGGHGLRSKTMLRALTRCGCPSGAPFGARSEFRSAAPCPSIAGCPQRSAGTRQVGSPFFCLLFLAKQRKVGALPGAHPGLQRHQKHYAFNSCLRPPGLVKRCISSINPGPQFGAERSDGPSSPHPLWPCREAQGVGRAWAAQQDHASCSDSLRLFERSAKGAKRVPQRRPTTEHRRLPAAKRRDTASGVAFPLPTFFWQSKRK